MKYGCEMRSRTDTHQRAAVCWQTHSLSRPWNSPKDGSLSLT